MIYSDEAYKLAAIAAAMMPRSTEDPKWEQTAEWACQLVSACEEALGEKDG